MFNQNFKVAWRNFIRHRWYSFLNVGGLSIGMACSILILLWVWNESSYDTFHANANEIYRLTADAGNNFKAAVSPAGMIEQLPDEMSEIKSSLRLSKPFEALFQIDDKKLKVGSVYLADENFLDVFTFPLISGNIKTALARTDGMLITEATAKKFFGNKDPMGRVVRFDNRDNFTVTGVLANVTSNSHLHFNIVLPMAYYAKTNSDLINNVWDSFNFYGYLLFNKNAISSPETRSKSNEKINQIYAARVTDFEVHFDLQPLRDIHLHSNLQIDIPGHGNIQYVNIFFIVAFIILVVACINYMNLATARSSRRAKEVGLRKAIGAKRNQLILQFLGESLMISFFSLAVAIGMVYLLLPAFNDLAEKQLVLRLWDAKTLVALLTIALITGLISGSYPALLLSALNPIKVLKGRIKLAGYNLLFRNGLVISQFVVSVLLLVGTAVIYKQLNFIKDKNLGFEKSNLLYIPMEGEIPGKQEALETALAQNPLTSDYSIIVDLPTNLNTGDFDLQWEGKDPDSQVLFPSIAVDENFIDLFRINILEGRGFSKEFSEENANYMINEKAAKVMDMDINNAVGQSLTFRGNKGTIIGVVEDFNYKPLQYAIEPLVVLYNVGAGIVVVRTTPGKTKNTIEALEKIYSSLNPLYPLAYNFVDADLDAQYRGEQQMGVIFNAFAILAIFISCLGLYGLSAYMTEQRFKEIGIRKVLGASVPKLVNMLSRDFFKLVLIALTIATPLSWLFMNKWLQDFAYRIKISWWIFATAGIIILVLTLLTVCYQVVNAALKNPVNSLRSE